MATRSVNSLLTGRGPPTTKLPLPPEIMELIFRHMEESTFFVAVCTCQQFLAAGTTRQNLLRQVRRLPGLRPGLEDLYGSRLRAESFQRATESGCIAGVLADLRKCPIPAGTIVGKSAFSPTVARKCTQTNHRLALANENGTIGIYELTEQAGDVRLNFTLDLNDLDNRKWPVNIVCLAFSPKGDLAVLCEQGHSVCYPGHSVCGHEGYYRYHLPGFEPTPECVIRKIYELTTFYRCYDKQRDPVNCQTTCRRSRVLDMAEAKPIGIALASTGNVSIAWMEKFARSRTSEVYPFEVSRTRDYQVELVRTSKKPATDAISMNKEIGSHCE